MEGSAVSLAVAVRLFVLHVPLVGLVRLSHPAVTILLAIIAMATGGAAVGVFALYVQTLSNLMIYDPLGSAILCARKDDQSTHTISVSAEFSTF